MQPINTAVGLTDEVSKPNVISKPVYEGTLSSIFEMFL